MLESFEAYKSSERFKNTKIHPDEYMKVLNSINFDISESSLNKCLNCFELSSEDKLDYKIFCEAVMEAKNPRAKGMKNIRKYKTEDKIYEYLASQCSVYFPIGSLLKDHDFKNDGKIEASALEKILREGASDMTEGDIEYFISRLEEGDGRIDSKELLGNINYFIKDREMRQKLESKIPQKLLVPMDETEKDKNKREKQERREKKK